MSFYDIYTGYKDFDLERAVVKDGLSFAKASAGRPDAFQLARLLSSEAEGRLEEMAQKARDITRRYFGRTIQLYTPLYISNYCDNHCAYCGFSAANDIARRRLEPDEVEEEARFISSTGLKHILVLTGESRAKSPLAYIKECVRILRKYFNSIAIEIYPLIEEEYAGLISEGVDSLTIYQEVYDEDVYSRMHPRGPKSDYRFRLDAPERGASGGMRNVTIGALLGLNDWRQEAFLMGLHAKYLQDKFPDVEIGTAVPRLRPQVAGFEAPVRVSDKNIVQIILAMRIFLPRAGITISTREDASLRENLLSLGVTRMSAGSITRVGGHAHGDAGNAGAAFQFEISDRRNVDEMKAMLRRKGYEPILKDWI